MGIAAQKQRGGRDSKGVAERENKPDHEASAPVEAPSPAPDTTRKPPIVVGQFERALALATAIEALVDANLRPLAGELKSILETALSEVGAADVIDLAAERARRGA